MLTCNFESGKPVGTRPVSSTSTLVKHGGIAEMNDATFLASFCFEVGKQERLITTEEVHARSLNLSIAVLDPIDRVRPRSSSTRVDWLARLNGVATIHAEKDIVQNQHPESKNHQSKDWHTNRLIPKPDHVLLQWVILRLRIQIEGKLHPFGPQKNLKNL